MFGRYLIFDEAPVKLSLMAYMVTAYVVTAYMLTVYVVTAYMLMAYMVMAYMVMGCCGRQARYQLKALAMSCSTPMPAS